MSNNKFKYLFFAAVFFISVNLSAQEKPIAPVPPEAATFDFDFQDFNNLSDKEEQEILKNVKEEIKRELKQIKNVNKNRYYDLLRESQFKNMEFPFVSKLEKDAREREKKIFELEVKTESLAAKYDAANKAEKEKIKSELKQQLSDLFNQKEEVRKQDVARLEQELKELKQSLQVRMQNKNEIINRRMQELLNEDEYLDWE
ncbi:MAG: hypothetical protein HYS24_13990 [Ignavibacteriales bacterium]|nr:hypothetical protein [Ignavibacteriales bacterium]